MKRAIAGLPLLTAVLAGPAFAADLVPYSPPLPPASNDLIITLSVNGEAGPRFPGARDLTFYGYPGVSFRRANEPLRFSAPDDGLSIVVAENAWIRGGIAARFLAGRYFGDDRRYLFGLRDVPWTIEPGVFVELWPVDFIRARAEIRHGIRASQDGFVANLGLDYLIRTGAFTFALGPRMALGDDRWTQTWFGVTPFESALNGVLPAYRPQGGITSVGAAGSVRYQWSPQWATTVYGAYNYLVGDAGDSPISRIAGSRDQITVGAGVSYSFAWP